jgi:hypothetical protein
MVLADAENLPLKNDRFSDTISEDHLTAEAARALMAATADVVGEQVSEARKRLTAAIPARSLFQTAAKPTMK